MLKHIILHVFISPFPGKPLPIFRLAHVKLIQARQTMCFRNIYRESCGKIYSELKVLRLF